MRTASPFAALFFLLVACGREEPERTAGSDSTPPARDAAPKAKEARATRDPCAPLDAKMVRYDTRGKPFFFSFERPEKFVVDEFYGPGVAGADLTFNADGAGANEYVLRLVQNSRTNENVERGVELWRKLPTTGSVSEVGVDGRTLYIQRSKVGDMISFQALFPDFDVADGGHLILGGVTSAPKPCRDQAAETVERILKSLERNPDVGEAPAKS